MAGGRKPFNVLKAVWDFTEPVSADIKSTRY